MRQQMADRRSLASLTPESRQVPFYRVVQLELPLIEQPHQGDHADRFRDRSQEKHRLLVARPAKRRRPLLAPLPDMERRRSHQLGVDRCLQLLTSPVETSGQRIGCRELVGPSAKHGSASANGHRKCSPRRCLLQKLSSPHDLLPTPRIGPTDGS